MPNGRRRGWILLAALLGTFAAVRAWLAFTPNADFDIAGYNVHHVFTGVVILTACGLPLLLGRTTGRVADVLTAGFGVGLSLALDEVVYLIATDGSNASYLLPVSFWGGVVFVGAAALVILILIWRSPP